MSKVRKALRDKEYYLNHRDKILVQRHQRYWNNPEKARAATRVYYQDHKQEFNDYRRQWRKQNPDKMKAQSQRARLRNPELWKLKLEKLNAWAVEHGYQLVYLARRRARLRGLPSTLTPEQWEAIKAIYHYRCAYCGKKKPLTQDHIIAATHGGGYTLDNIVPACRSCNSRKSSNLPPVDLLRVLLL
jgi:5-methylcytosine-specific restriction endonuclease McrA